MQNGDDEEDYERGSAVPSTPYAEDLEASRRDFLEVNFRTSSVVRSTAHAFQMLWPWPSAAQLMG